MRRTRNVLSALEVFHRELGDLFRIDLPGFQPVMMAGPEAARFVLVEAKDDLRWRNPTDPVARLLRHGVLVVDGDEHDELRALMQDALHRKMLMGYANAMIACTDQVTGSWGSKPLDLLVEMRKVALLILTRTLFGYDLSGELAAVWGPVLKSIGYISPGLWMIWPGAPRPGYDKPLAEMDAFLYRMIDLARQPNADHETLLGHLVSAGLDDGTIRDQLLTMLIAGHDTSTALLSWSLALLGQHPDMLMRVQAEVDTVCGTDRPTFDHAMRLTTLKAVTDEALRLYPPIHLGSRLAAVDIPYQGAVIPAGTRVIYSIYLTQRDPKYWPDADQFQPDRWLDGFKPTPYTFLPFGGGKRNCIGALYGDVETRLVLARLLQQFQLHPVGGSVRPSMGATLEPRPGVWIQVERRT